MNSTKKRISMLAVLVCVFALVFSLGIMSACGNSGTPDNQTANGNWYYGAEVPAEGLGREGDYYLNTDTLASYMKTEDGTWQETSANWYYGTDDPHPNLGSEHDFYLNTETGALYQKNAEGWGSSILTLKGEQGRPGRDGVVWYSGDTEPEAAPEASLQGLQEGDFYLRYPDFIVYQYVDGAWKELGSLKGAPGESDKNVGWVTGQGAPTEGGVTLEEDGFYLDTESGDIWQGSVQDESTTWTKCGSAYGKEIEKIERKDLQQVVTYAQYYFVNWLNEEDFALITDRDERLACIGYLFTYADKSLYFFQSGCAHTTLTSGTKITLYDHDCEKGTIEYYECPQCKEWVVKVTTPDKISNLVHHFDTEVWRYNETKHWHARTCSHSEVEDIDVNEHAFFTYATPKVTEDNQIDEGHYMIWKECSVCGYKEHVVTKEDFTQEDDIIHISNAQDWNAVVNLINQAADTTGWKIRLDADIDFKGAELKPIGIPTNVKELVKLDEIGYAYDTEKTVEGGFKGEFDGQNKTFSNFTINGTHFAGLFGCLNGGTVKNLKIKDAKIKGDAFVGAVAGFITGENARITNVETTDVVVDGNRHVGGIAGYAYKAGPAISTNSVNADSQEAAIKECVVKGSDTNGYFQIFACVDYAQADGYYWNGANLGGILGTAIASSVIKCETENIQLEGYSYTNHIVGYAEGIDTSNKAVVASNTVYHSNGTYVLAYLEGAVAGGGTQLYSYKLGYEKIKGSVEVDGTYTAPYAATLNDSQTTSYSRNNKNYVVKAGENVVNSGNKKETARPVSLCFSKILSEESIRADFSIGDMGSLMEFANNVNNNIIDCRNSVITITEDIDMSGEPWTPINAFSDLFNYATIDGQGHTLSGMHFGNGDTSKYPFGLGFISSVKGNFTMQDLIFDQAVVTVTTELITGNVIGVVCGYVYGTTLFKNITVQNCEIYGYGKVGGIVGMGADPGVAITFEDCTSKNNTFYAGYNAGGFAGNIQRATDGKDNTVFKGNNVAENNTHNLFNETTLDVEATFYYNDRSGESYSQKVNGTYVLLNGDYYYGGWAEYYVSYGSSTYDPPITTEGYTGYSIANSEICMNEPTPFVHDAPIIPEA